MATGKGQFEPKAALLFVVWASVMFVFIGGTGSFWFWFFIGMEIDLVCHESGHLLFAVLGSMQVHAVILGGGPLIWRRRFGETWLDVRMFPWMGLVVTYPLADRRPRRDALFTLGGPLGNVAVLCAVAGLHAVHAIPEIAAIPVMAAQVFTILTTMFPFSIGVDDAGTRFDSDGMQLLKILRGTDDLAARIHADYEARVRAYRTGDAQLTMSDASSRILLHAGLLAVGRDPGHDSREALLRELTRGGLALAEKMWVLDTLVIDAIVSGDPAVRLHLDAWSQQALALGPDLPVLQGSRGAALVELGRHAEGKALLVPLAVRAQAASFESFMSRTCLALAEHGLGNDAAARQWADEARATAEAAGKTPRITAMLARLDGMIPPTA